MNANDVTESVDNDQRFSRDVAAVFDAIDNRMKENPDLFTRKEKKAFKAVKNNYAATVDPQISSLGYNNPCDSNNYKHTMLRHENLYERMPQELIPFGIAHETKHATLKQNHDNGTFNICSISNITYTIKDKASLLYKPVITFGQKLFSNPESTFLKVIGIYTLLFGKVMQRVCEFPNSITRKQEEFLCDNFAFRVFPNTDTNLLRDWLDHTSGLKELRQEIKKVAQVRSKKDFKQLDPRFIILDMYTLNRNYIAGNHPYPHNRAAALNVMAKKLNAPTTSKSP